MTMQNFDSTEATSSCSSPSQREYRPPRLQRLGSLTSITLAGMGTIAELGYFHMMGAMTCLYPDTLATNTMKYPCG